VQKLLRFSETERSLRAGENDSSEIAATILRNDYFRELYFFPAARARRRAVVVQAPSTISIEPDGTFAAGNDGFKRGELHRGSGNP
jgi:hypothetical protein